MEWTYVVTKPFTFHVKAPWETRRPPVELTFNPGEIDKPLYDALAVGYPECVQRRPKDPLVAAVWQVRGLLDGGGR